MKIQNQRFDLTQVAPDAVSEWIDSLRSRIALKLEATNSFDTLNSNED